MSITRGVGRIRPVGGEQILISGSFRPNGASGVVSSSEKGAGWSVARSGTGLYTVTFNEKLRDGVRAIASIREAGADFIHVQCGDYVAASRTLQIRVGRPLGGGITGFIPLDITALREIASDDIQALAAHGGLLTADSDPSLARVNGATDKALRVTWDTSNDTDEVAFPSIPWPPDLDASQDVSVHLLAKMAAGGMDTPVIDVQAWEGEGDTEMGGATAALSTTLAELSVTLGNANITGHPGFLNLQLVPGAHTNEALHLYAAWLEYSKEQALQGVDLSADADNEISFWVISEESTSAVR